MFVDEVDAQNLRQGDILSGIRFPRLVLEDERVLGKISAEAKHHCEAPAVTVLTHDHRGDTLWLTGQVPLRICFGIVLSQCCDLELKNGKFRMPAFALARLIPIPPTILANPLKLISLRANKDPRDPNDPGYINYFHIPSHALLGDQEWVVDYNQTICIPGSEFAGVLPKKILEMDDRTRVKFKVKLMASFSRLTNEERAAGLENPWAPE